MWELRPADPAAVARLAGARGVSPLMARLLALRGIEDTQAAERFLHPRLEHLRPPGEMAGLPAAAERLCQALSAGQRIGVFGDYDVDGVTSATIVADYLGRAGGEVVRRVARRDEGYGFGEAQALELLEQGCAVLVLTDCGTSDHDAVGIAAARGVAVLAVDHHRVATGAWPGTVLVNPHRQDCGFPFKGLCSAGLAFYLVASLRRVLEARGMLAPDPRQSLDLVALGTLADVAPLTEENRILVHRGLQQLGCTQRPGLRALLHRCDLGGKEVSAEHVLWRLAPRLNAPGRLGDASVALGCLSATDEAQGAQLAEQCDQLNEQRKALQKRVHDEARKAVGAGPERAFVLAAGDGWHPGVVGIVAAKLVDEFGCPAGVVALEGETGRGSARSVKGVDLFSLLQGCSDKLVRFGGHAAAAGFTVARDQIGELRESLDLATRPKLASMPERMLQVDGVLELETITERLCEELSCLAPHGAGNPAPVFAAHNVKVESARKVGADHVALVISDNSASRPAIGFGMLSRAPRPGDRIEVAFVPEMSEYHRGGPRLRLIDLAPADTGSAPQGDGAS